MGTVEFVEIWTLRTRFDPQVKYYGRDPASGKIRLSRKVLTVAKVNIF